jgi:alpha,alpha-trehalase
VRTNQSQVLISQAARTRVFVDDTPLTTPPTRLSNGDVADGHPDDPVDGWVGQQFDVDVADGQQVRIEKVVWLFTSRDGGSGEPATEACSWARATPHDFDVLLQRHVVAWRQLWDHVDITVGADGVVSRYIHLHLFHVLQTLSPHSVFTDAGVPARGLHGEAYRGHVFWDEVFVLPLLSLQLPQIAYGALMYRYRRLDMARRLAAEAGFSGAMFPWQSGSNGREETQSMHLNPLSGRWLPDASHLQRHVNAAIAHNVWHYYQSTADIGFLTSYGGELILEIARFWASASTYNHALDRFEILGVMGPDEYHEAYPGGPPGINNNAYTNIMAVWCLCRAFEVLEVLPPAAARDLIDSIGLTSSELDHWGEVSRKMRVCFHDGVISQFEGFEDLTELDWDHYRQRYGDISRLDRILEAEGDSTNRYKLTKQADVMMLFFVLSAEELAAILQRLGYRYDAALIPATIAYYEPRTAHGSTLSRVVHSWIHARANRSESWRLFCEALHSDVNDIQGGTTAEGIHLGAMAGTIDLLQRCYTGLELTHDRLRLNPVVPDQLAPLEFDVRYRSHLVHLRFDTNATTVRMDNDEGGPIVVEFAGVCHDLTPGNTLTFT